MVDFVVVESVFLSVGIVVVEEEEPLEVVLVDPAKTRPVERAIMAVAIRRRLIRHLLITKGDVPSIP
ncbi:hypothetical protein [Mesorhizobium sp.]|uniref:hypothetical protein n=1 Tax=Mesorhizobium sp. TaxID=1871066 RepID=UPI000FE50EB5|nr:hypothetical protein [Mesorhizobium sp.]RWC49366.1 MAG: hypothetical protein EOS55_06830 [Mesorhizobium sp.]RWC64271.1 MAG: hypothetical protein EOS56_00895 [Mesorhizobium sp.]RWC67138.1 MAG: hypothetical protein EOS29_01725 [Mesorhizobium sp.]